MGIRWKSIGALHDSYINVHKSIFDRGHFSEIVYGDLWRGGHGMSAQEIDALNEYVFNNFLVIFAYAPEDILKKRYHSRSYDRLLKVMNLQLFNHILTALLTQPHVLKYDSTSLIVRDAMVEKILYCDKAMKFLGIFFNKRVN